MKDWHKEYLNMLKELCDNLSNAISSGDEAEIEKAYDELGNRFKWPSMDAPKKKVKKLLVKHMELLSEQVSEGSTLDEIKTVAAKMRDISDCILNF